MPRGYIYVLSNAAMPGLLKIGKSERNPSEFRAIELYTTGVPEPFRLEYYMRVDDYHAAEKRAHDHFLDKRPNRTREFFRISVAEALIGLRSICLEREEWTHAISQEQLEREKRRLWWKESNRVRKEEFEKGWELRRKAEEAERRENELKAKAKQS